MVADESITAHGVLVDLLQRRAPEPRLLLALVTEERQRPLDRFAQHGERGEGDPQAVDGAQREMARHDADVGVGAWANRSASSPTSSTDSGEPWYCGIG